MKYSSDIAASWKDLDSMVKSTVLDKEVLLKCIKKLGELYSKLFSYRADLVCKIRSASLNESKEDLDKSLRHLVLRGFAADERQRFQELSQSESVREAKVELEILDEYLAGCKRIEVVVNLVWQIVSLEYKLSGMSV